MARPRVPVDDERGEGDEDDGGKQKDLEQELQAHRCAANPDITVWDYLHQHHSPLQAASDILAGTLGAAENVASLASHVWRWIQVKELWNEHPDVRLRSEDALISSIDGGSGMLRVLVVAGTATDMARRRHIDRINEAWGDGWFGRIPVEMRPVDATRPEMLSRRMLEHICDTAVEERVGLDESIAGWKQAMERRLNPHTRASQPGKRLSTEPRLVVTDVKSLNGTGASTAVKTNKAERLELKALRPKRKRRSDDPGAATSKRQRRGKGLSGPIVVNSGEESESEGQRSERASCDEGDKPRWRVRRVRNHLIREPVTQNRDGSASSSAAGSSSEFLKSTGPVAASCHGPQWLSVFQQMIDHYATSATGEMPRRVRDCCETCRPLVMESISGIKTLMEPLLLRLKQVDRHVVQGSTVPVVALYDEESS